MKKPYFASESDYVYVNGLIGNEIIRLDEAYKNEPNAEKRMELTYKKITCTLLLAMIDSDHKLFLYDQLKKKTKQLIDDAIDDSINHARRFVEAIK